MHRLKILIVSFCLFILKRYRLDRLHHILSYHKFSQQALNKEMQIGKQSIMDEWNKQTDMNMFKKEINNDDKDNQ